MAFDEAVRLFQQFKKAFEQQPSDLDTCESLLPRLKILVTKLHGFIPTTEEDTKELLLTREIFELASLLSVKLKDIPSFERHIAQVKRFYNDAARYPIPPSERQYPILGLNLLHLLAANRLAEFHTELELIPIEMHKNNIYIKHPIQLEQYLMEGAYNKLWNARADVPADTYTFFMDILMDTVRSEIAECSEKAYKSLSLSEAQKSLLFSSPNDLLEFAKKREWEVSDGKILFSYDDKKKAKAEVPSLKLIHQTLAYAKELERIV